MPSSPATDDMATGPLDELLEVLPRWVGRTRSQAEIVRSLAGMLPCVGGLVARRDRSSTPGAPEHERIDVVSVLADDSADEDAATVRVADGGRSGAGQEPVSAAAAEGTEPPADTPAEGDLAIQDYDSLAASQVVPRLSTLDADELRAVQAYESATRHRQTILNRVAQLLAEA